jgi:predicted cupin superfamily sugar epimerase
MDYFHGGSPILYFVLDPNGTLEQYKLGLDIAKGEILSRLVPGDYWKAAVLKAGELRDMEIAQPETFRQQFPHLWEQLSQRC